MDPRVKDCRRRMREATEYLAWCEAAGEFDRITGRADWREDETSTLYDYRLIKVRLRHMRHLRESGQIVKLVRFLRQGLYWNLGNMCNPALYGRALLGTKQLIHDYTEEVAATLNFICDNQFPDLGHGDKLRFFNETALSFGRSSLMLSGGATLGLFHVGVVRALILEKLLPMVISGSSAGSVVAAAIGTRTPEELPDLLEPANAYYHFWKLLGLRQMFHRRVLMDSAQTRRAIAANIPDLTFEESFRRSGRIINITVSPAELNQPPRLLNYLTFPYLYVREAVMASSAVPLLFEPVMLMTRDENGRRVPYLPSLRWTDGSLRSDLPGLRMRRLHNVNHFIVSQTNPHVIPFLQKHLEEQGMLGAARDWVYSLLRGTAQYAIGLGRLSAPIRTVRHTLDYASSILDQDYRGNITILPKVTVWRYANVTANPKLDEVRRFIREGERATWRRMAMLRNQTLIANTLEDCVRRLELPRGTAERRAARRRPTLSVVRHGES